MKWCQVKIPDDLHHAAKTVAAARRITMKALILESLAESVARGYSGEHARPRPAADG